MSTNQAVPADVKTISHPFSKTADDIAAALVTDIKNGLSAKEAEDRLVSYGYNSLGAEQSRSLWTILFGQFRSPFIWLLAVAAGLSYYFKDVPEAIAILSVLAINTLIGFYMEYQAERSMAALKRMVQIKSKVIRDGQLSVVSSEEVVPGDILYLEAGDMITADARIISFSQLYIDETPLTGESLPVEKDNKVLTEDTVLADRINILHKGTVVTRGNCRAVVTGTGLNTELGKIATLVEGSAHQETPLEKKIGAFSNKILLLVVGLIVAMIVAGLLQGKNFYQLLQTAIALAVAAIPEGLPIVTTLALARAMLKMSAHNVIVKNLSSIEALGSTTVICTDKTGTLTQNDIVVNTILTPGHRLNFSLNTSGQTIEYEEPAQAGAIAANIKMAATISALCNTAELKVTDKGIEEFGDPLETALLKFAWSAGVSEEEINARNEQITEIPFSSETKLMATAHRMNDAVFVAVKGAADEVLNICDRQLENGLVTALSAEQRSVLFEKANTMAAEGLRVIALAYNEREQLPEVLYKDLVICGLIGMMDPPAEGVDRAIAQCKEAGIKVIMITGDHPETARNIGLTIGLTENRNEDVVHGKEMPEYAALNETEKKRWLTATIFARVTPQQKLDLVTLLQNNNEVVGMTGDGVNDAPALKKADIGIAMGIRGTQAAQEAADMVLKDDAFSSIISAVYQGRVIFNNIRMFVVYLLSCNISELIIVSVTSFLDLGFVLSPLQILYINLATDVLPALALGVTRGSSNLMQQPPRNPSEPLVGGAQWRSILVYSLVISGCAIAAAQSVNYLIPTVEDRTGIGNNMLFATLILCQLLHVFNMNQDIRPASQGSALLQNSMIWLALLVCIAFTVIVYLVPAFAAPLLLQVPPVKALAVIFGCSFASLIIIQVLKKLRVTK